MDHSHSQKPLILILLLVLLDASCQKISNPEPKVEPQAKATVKYGVTVEPGPMDSLLLKDYAPDSSLVVAQTQLDKARFATIDVHTHIYADTSQEVEAWVKTMDEVGIELTVILTDAVGPEFDRLAGLYLKKYPKHFELYCGLDTSHVDASDYSERAVDELVRCYQNGARGVGELSDKGWGFGGTSDNHLPRG